jgi:hypothetical protein
MQEEEEEEEKKRTKEEWFERWEKKNTTLTDTIR